VKPLRREAEREPCGPTGAGGGDPAITATLGVQKAAEGSVLFAMGRRGCCARPRSRSGCRRSSAARGKAGSPRSTPCSRVRRARGSPAKGAPGGAGPDVRDPGSWGGRWGGRGLRGARRADDHARLRRAAGRRGTRTASINGAWIALWQACRGLVEAGGRPATRCSAGAAVSVGVVGGGCSRTSTTPRTRRRKWT
jgi:hypothetical protein